MKKTFLMALLCVYAYAVRATGYSYRVNGSDVNLSLVGNKINVKLKSAMTQDQVIAALHNTMLVSDPNDHGKSAVKLLKLNATYDIDHLKKLIEQLDKNSNVDYASLALSYNNTLEAMSNVILVKASSGDQVQELRDICDDQGLTFAGSMPNLPEALQAIQLPVAQVVNQFDLVHYIMQYDDFEYVQPNLFRYISLSTTPNDPQYSSQYALSKINASYAWDKTHGGAGTIRIAVIDVGMDFNHPDLAPSGTGSISGYDAYYNSRVTLSSSDINTFGSYLNNDWHGTACAGIIRANTNNATGIAGLAYGCSLLSIHFGANASGNQIQTDDLAMAEAFHYANYSAQVDVISCSWKGTSPSTTVEDEITDAVANGRQGKGCPVFFSAGNDTATTIPWPASMDEVIAVGATVNGSTTAQETKAIFSNQGAELDISAPGDAIITTDVSSNGGSNTAYGSAGDYITASGTSFSCPYAAGLMGLILSTYSDLTEADARDIIESTCTETGGYSYTGSSTHPAKNWSNELGYGRINAQAAIDKALSMVPALPTNTPLSVTLTPQVSPVCYNENEMPYFDIQVTGGTPYMDQYDSLGFTYFALSYYNDSGYSTMYPYINGQGSIIVTSTNPSFPASNTKRIYLNNLSGLTTAQFPLNTTVYVDLLDGAHVHHHYSIPITVQRAPSFTLPPHVYTCLGNAPYAVSATVTYAPSGTQYSWDFGQFQGNQYGTSYAQITSATGSSIIGLTAADPNSGCSVTETTDFHFIQMAFDSLNQYLCIGSAPKPIYAHVYNGTGNYSYSWSPATGLSATNVLNPNFSLTSAAGTYTYTLTVTDNIAGCSQTAVYAMHVQSPQTTVSVTPDQSGACPGKNVILYGTFTGPYSTFSNVSYSGGTGTVSTTYSGTSATAVVAPMTSTTYTLTATEPGGCVVSGTGTVNVNTGYSLSVNAGPDIISCSMPAKTITASASGGTGPYTYQWMPGNTTSPVFTVPHSIQTYTVTATDSYGCKAVDDVHVSTEANMTIANMPIYSICSGSSVVYTTSTTPSWNVGGGTPPYSYEWFPHSDFVNPYVLNPTTVPLTASTYPILYVTDANGCQAYSPNDLMVFGNNIPASIYVESDVCSSSKQICLSVGGGLSPLGNIVNNTVLNDTPENPYGGGVTDINQWVINSYTFSPTPTSQSGSCATFSSGTSSVSITLNQSTIYPYYNYTPCTAPTVNYTYTFPSKDNARHLLIELPSSELIYVGTDQVLHRMWWTPASGWQWETITPTNGWGNIRVEGWLAQNEDGSRVLFKSTDGKLHSLARYAGTNNWLLESYTMATTDVKGDIAYRSNEIYYVGTDDYVHRVYWSSHAWHYDAIAPVGGWQGIAVDGNLLLEPAGTGVYFKTTDNRLFNFWGGTLGAPNLSEIYTAGFAGEMIFNPAGGMIYKGTDNKLRTLAWTGSAWVSTLLQAQNNPGYSVDGYLAIDPSINKIFYKAQDKTIHDFYPSGGGYNDDALDYYMTNTAGDLVWFDNKLAYINKDKKVHQFQWTGSSWWDSPMNSSAPANVKACSNQFKSMLASGEPDNDDETTETQNADDVSIYPNPSEGLFTVSFNNAAEATIDVYDVLGNNIRSVRKEKDKPTYELNLAGAAKGIYLLRVVSEGKQSSKKVVIR